MTPKTSSVYSILNSMPFLSFSAVRAPPQSPVSVSCSQIDFALLWASAGSAASIDIAANSELNTTPQALLQLPANAAFPSPPEKRVDRNWRLARVNK